MWYYACVLIGVIVGMFIMGLCVAASDDRRR